MKRHEIAEPATGELILASRAWPRVMNSHFAGPAVVDSVVTRAHLPFSMESAWKRLMFYEEVPGHPPFPLNVFMPFPVRTDGDKSEPGALVRCTYNGGSLVKRITAIEPLRLIAFDVIEQNLGIEGCVIALGGSYRIHEDGDGVAIVLTTRYRAFLHPRPVWHLLEKLVANQLHRHVLEGMRAFQVDDAAVLHLPLDLTQTGNPV